jgi:hypothetical protein
MKRYLNKDRGFHWFSQATYAHIPHDFDDEVLFGFYPNGGNEGTIGEMGLRWHHLGYRSVPRLESYSDSWKALAHMQDVLDELAANDRNDITPEYFCTILTRLGFRDLTSKPQPAVPHA